MEQEFKTNYDLYEESEKFEDGLGGLYTADKKVLLKFNNSKATSYTILEGTEIICDSAFRTCSWEKVNAKSLTEIQFPDSLICIGRAAFEDCRTLSCINLPTNTYCKERAFSYCGLKKVIIPEGWTTIANGLFSENPLEEIVLPSSLVSIRANAFRGTNISNLHLPEGLTEIGDAAFFKCKNLSSVNLSANVHCGSYVFRGCALKNIIIPEGWTTIEYELFSGNPLEEVILPSTLTSIGESAFECCENLSTIQLPEGLQEIGERAFFDCVNLTGIHIPQSVTSIAKFALSSYSLQEIYLPDVIQTIGETIHNPSHNLSALQTIWIPEHTLQGWIEKLRETNNVLLIRYLKEQGSLCSPDPIWNEIYQNITDVYSLNCSRDDDFEDGLGGIYSADRKTLKWIEEGTKKYSVLEGTERIAAIPTTLTHITLPSTLKYIGTGAFSECKKLKDITLPNGLLFIGEKAFSKCNGLKNIVLPDSVVYVGERAFEECKKLETVVLSKGLLRVKPYTFGWCEKLRHVEISEGIRYLGRDVFACDNDNHGDIYLPLSIKKLYAPEGVYGWGLDTFERIIIPKGSKDYFFSLTTAEWLREKMIEDDNALLQSVEKDEPVKKSAAKNNNKAQLIQVTLRIPEVYTIEGRKVLEPAKISAKLKKNPVLDLGSINYLEGSMVDEFMPYSQMPIILNGAEIEDISINGQDYEEDYETELSSISILTLNPQWNPLTELVEPLKKSEMLYVYRQRDPWTTDYSTLTFTFEIPNDEVFDPSKLQLIELASTNENLDKDLSADWFGYYGPTYYANKFAYNGRIVETQEEITNINEEWDDKHNDVYWLIKGPKNEIINSND